MLGKFGNGGSLEQHGFARNKIWAIDDDPPPLRPNDSHGKSFVDLVLRPSEEDLKCWPYRYEHTCQFICYLISRINNLWFLKVALRYSLFPKSFFSLRSCSRLH